MQVPKSGMVSVAPETEQMVGVVEENVTGRPELAVAFKVSWVRAYCLPVTGVKLAVCGAKSTAKLCAVVAEA